GNTLAGHPRRTPGDRVEATEALIRIERRLLPCEARGRSVTTPRLRRVRVRRRHGEGKGERQGGGQDRSSTFHDPYPADMSASCPGRTTRGHGNRYGLWGSWPPQSITIAPKQNHLCR